ncbi:hypothetical protein COCON_G00211900 [Conger conger]|uniref:Uncharacterized protein n=1 Tax=Conger conger TaxID=82655 RepID=A0A9Q1D0W3_CONCO|nr:hypothetical protein COCON_G00211900 [Conger conger]
MQGVGLVLSPAVRLDSKQDQRASGLSAVRAAQAVSRSRTPSEHGCTWVSYGRDLQFNRQRLDHAIEQVT